MAELFHKSLAVGLRTAYLRMHRATNRNFLPFDVTADQYVLLRLLNDENGQTQQSLTELTSSDPTTVSSMVRLLENRGFVVRKTDKRDRRAKRVYLTRLGQKKCAELFESAAWIRQRLSRVLSDREMEYAMKALNKIAEAFETEAECLQGQRKWSPARSQISVE